MKQQLREFSVTYGDLVGGTTVLGNEKPFVKCILAMLAEAVDAQEGLHGQIWVHGLVVRDVLLSAIASCIDEHQSARIHVPSVSASTQGLKYVSSWFTTDLPRGDNASDLAERVDWQDTSIVLQAAIYPREHIPSCWDQTWQSVRDHILNETGARTAVLMDGYFDTDVFRFYMTTEAENLVRKALEHHKPLFLHDW